MEEIITRIVESVYQKTLQASEQIINRGKNSLVFKITIDNSDLILRCRNSDEQLTLYEKEEWCSIKASKVGVKTPKIFYTGNLDAWSYSIQEYVAGTHGTNSDQTKVWFTLGEYARLFHTISAENIAVNYEQKINDLFNNDFYISNEILEESVSDAIRNRLNETISWDFERMLCHGNLHPSNVIVDASGEVWLLDWETATGNRSPHADLAEIYTWNNGKDNINEFCRGYGLKDVNVIMRDIQTLVLLRLLDVIHKKILHSKIDEWKSDPFVLQMKELLPQIGDITQDVLFAKNM